MQTFILQLNFRTFLPLSSLPKKIIRLLPDILPFVVAFFSSRSSKCVEHHATLFGGSLAIRCAGHLLEVETYIVSVENKAENKVERFQWLHLFDFLQKRSGKPQTAAHYLPTNL